MYSPVYKDDNGERVLQIGFKKFTVDESCSKYEVDVWIATSIGQVLEPQEVDDKSRNVGENIQRLTKLFQAGDISAEEFSLLIGQATGESERQSENDARKFEELEERADLAEYQSLWLAIFSSNMPLSLDQNPLHTRVLSLKREFEALPRHLDALTNLTADTHGLNFLARGQIANEIARSIKKGKPLPELTTQSISRLKAEMNSQLNPLRQFAKRQGWREVPFL
jgi:hypothetical protein